MVPVKLNLFETQTLRERVVMCQEQNLKDLFFKHVNKKKNFAARGNGYVLYITANMFRLV